MPLGNAAEALGALDSELSEFAEHFTMGEYALWVGSAISRDVVPDVKVLMERALELLRANIDPGDTECPHRSALEEVLDVAGVTEDIRRTLDFTAPVHSWSAGNSIVMSVVNKYSDVLNVYPSGEDPDYLVWKGLDVAQTFGDPDLEPDAEHYCLAILMLEGVAAEVLTTNWDGLIEAALERLVQDPEKFLRVAVTAADLRKPSRRSELVKFHGCAVRARLDEANYRPLLIARSIQISGWTTQHALMKERLQFIYTTKSALLVGLSAQDANIQSVFHQAIQNLERDWPCSPPAVVFANQHLDYHHKHVLQVTYGSSFAPNEEAIKTASLFGAYAKPALTALVLFTLTSKLASLLYQVPGLDPSDLAGLQADLVSIRDAAAAAVGCDERLFLESLIDLMRLASNTFRRGDLPDTGLVPYEPISTRPVEDAVQDADFPKEAIGRVALALALLARGRAAEGWSLSRGSCSDPAGGVLRVTTGNRTSRVFLLNDVREEARLIAAGYADEEPASVVLISARSVPPRATRSPRTVYGRTGRNAMRSVDLESIVADTCSVDELLEAFLLQGAF